MPVRVSSTATNNSSSNVGGRGRTIKTKVSRTSSNDNIRALSNMNKSLQKSYYQHAEPFRPAGAVKENLSPNSSPARERKLKHGFQYREVNPASSQEFYNLSEGNLSNSSSPDRLRRSQTEYSKKYPEWDLPSTERPLSPEKYSSLHNFNVDFGVSNWESENKRSYKPNYVASQTPQLFEVPAAAGVPTKRPAKVPPSYTWNGGKNIQDKENLDNGALKSESKFVWGPNQRNTDTKDHQFDLMYDDPDPQPSSHTHQETIMNRGNVDQQVQISEFNIDRPYVSTSTQEPSNLDLTASGEFKPFHRKKSDLVSMGNTEYKSNFIKRSVDQTENNSKKSGKKSKQKSKVFVKASEGDSGEVTDAYRQFREVSEYKSKFPEWPLPEKEENGRKERSTSLHNFDTSALVADWQSENHQAFPKHQTDVDLVEPIAPVAGISTKALDGNIPPSFAWAADRGDEAPRPLSPTRYSAPVKQRPEPYHVEHPNAYRETLSEYNREYHWPPQEAYHRTATRSTEMDRRESPELQKTLRFDDQKGLGAAKTEYQEQFFDLSQYATRMTTSNRRAELNPPQFAWPLVDGEAPKPVLVSPQRKQFSEHTAKFQWPITESVNPVKSPAVRPALTKEDLIPTDRDHNDPKKWQSEYDAQCAALRRRQQEIMKPIAGVITQRVDQIPTWFAWPEPAVVPPAPPAHQPTSADPNHFRTEYLDNYMRWQVAGGDKGLNAETVTKAQEDHLNLFLQDESVSSPKKGMASEYQEKFKALSTGANDALVQFKKKENEAAPPQFAWPLVDKPLPTPPPQRSKSPGVVVKTEYKSHFAWPPNPPAVEVKKPQDHYPLFGVDSNTNDPSQWKSEYDAKHNEKKDKDFPPSIDVPAGIISIPKDQIPSFFAWAEEEAKKVTRPSTAVKVYHNTEPLASETHEAFQKPKEAIIPPKYREEDTLNLFRGSKEEMGKFPPTFSTEYDDHFKDPAATSPASVAAVDITTQRADVERPPHFAWSLLEQSKDVESSQKSTQKDLPPSLPFRGRTEYDDQFTWGTTSTPMVKRTPSRGQVNIIAPNRREEETVGEVKRWESEYDARYSELRRQQQILAMKEAEDRNAQVVAGRKTPSQDSAPHFYVWSALDEASPASSPPLLERAKTTGPPDTTEYEDQFQGFKNANLLTLSNSQVAHSYRGEKTKSHIFGVDDDHLAGSTEYRDQFTPVNTVHSLDSTMNNLQRDAHQYHQGMKYGQSLRWTNLDRSAATAEAIEKMTIPRPPITPLSAKEMKRIQQIYTTEQQDRYHWPEKVSPVLPSATTPTSTVTETKRNINATAPAVINPINETVKLLQKDHSVVAPETPKDHARKVLLSATAPSVMQTTLTETQEKFSWPSYAPTVTTDLDNSRSAAKKKKTLKRQFQTSLPHRGTAAPSLYHSPGRRPWNYARSAPVVGSAQAVPTNHRQGETPSTSTAAAKKDSQKKYQVMTKTSAPSHSQQVMIASPTSRDFYSDPGSVEESLTTGSSPRPMTTTSHSRFHPSRVALDTEENQTTTVDTNRARYDMEGQSTTIRSLTTGGGSNTVLSQDSLNIVPSTNTVNSNTTTSTTVTTTMNNNNNTNTTDSNQYMNTTNAVARPARVAMGADDGTISTLGATATQIQTAPAASSSIPLSRGKDDAQVHNIPGLRASDPIRSRSAPPRRTLSAEFDQYHRPKMYVDETASANPVLLNRRYPAISDRQASRWSTEMKDSYRWSSKTN